MGQGRTITHQKFLIGELALSIGVAKFTPPKFKKKTGDKKGSFVGQKVLLGYDPLEWEIEIEMLDESLATEVEKDGNKTIATYVESGEDSNGDSYRVEHIMTGECEIDTGDSSNGEMKKATIKGVTVKRYKHTDGNKEISNIDIDAGEYLINGRRVKNSIK